MNYVVIATISPQTGLENSIFTLAICLATSIEAYLSALNVKR